MKLYPEVHRVITFTVGVDTRLFSICELFLSRGGKVGEGGEKISKGAGGEKKGSISGKIECQHNCGLPVGRNITKGKGWKRRFYSNLSFKLKTGAHASLHPVIFNLHLREILCPLSNPNETLSLSLSLPLFYKYLVRI